MPRDVRNSASIAALLAIAGIATAFAGDAAQAPGTASSVTFDRYSPLANSNEIMLRTLSPVAADRVLGYLRDKSQQLPEQSIDLSVERFEMYVPQGEQPAGGYGLLVFIPPSDEAKVPA